MLSAQEIGRRGEDAAARLLKQQGLRILARNWRAGQLELDLVCQDGDTLVFVEVKTRQANGFSSPAEAMTARKRLAWYRAAQAWLAAHETWNGPCRFDVIFVTRRGSLVTPEHYPHAFDLDTLVGRRHASGQYW